MDDCFLQVNTRCEISWKFLKSFWSLHKKWSSLLRISLVTFLMSLGKSSHSQMFFKIGVLKISQYSQKKTTCVGVLNKVAGLQACSFIKKRLQHKCFFVNIAKIFKNTFFVEHLRWLLLFILAGNGFRAYMVTWAAWWKLSPGWFMKDWSYYLGWWDMINCEQYFEINLICLNSDYHVAEYHSSIP